MVLDSTWLPRSEALRPSPSNTNLAKMWRNRACSMGVVASSWKSVVFCRKFLLIVNPSCSMSFNALSASVVMEAQILMYPRRLLSLGGPATSICSKQRGRSTITGKKCASCRRLQVVVLSAFLCSVAVSLTHCLLPLKDILTAVSDGKSRIIDLRRIRREIAGCLVRFRGYVGGYIWFGGTFVRNIHTHVVLDVWLTQQQVFPLFLFLLHLQAITGDPARTRFPLTLV